MKCPHCADSYHPNPRTFYLLGQSPGQGQLYDHDGYFAISSEICPACRRLIIHILSHRRPDNVYSPPLLVSSLVHPRTASRPPLSPHVAEMFATDYREAAAVLAISPKASAALSRRCLQHLLKVVARTTKKDLFDQIDEVMPSLPTFLCETIDAVRVLGNLAAHPTKNTHTGEIIDVEPGEADLLLEVLEMAFDHYIVKPADAKAKRDAINAKLASGNKPPMK